MIEASDRMQALIRQAPRPGEAVNSVSDQAQNATQPVTEDVAAPSLPSPRVYILRTYYGSNFHAGHPTQGP